MMDNYVEIGRHLEMAYHLIRLSIDVRSHHVRTVISLRTFSGYGKPYICMTAHLYDG